MPLRVIVNDRVLLAPLTGVGHYVAQLVAALRGLPEELDLRTPCARWVRPGRLRSDAPPVEGGSGPPANPRRRSEWIRRGAQAAYALGFRGLARGAQLYHEPNHIPIRSRLPTVTTIHDLSVLEHPEWHPADRVRWYERSFQAGLRQTRRFIAASEFTRQRMIDLLGIAPQRVAVTHQAPRPAFTTTDRAPSATAALPADLPARFFLFVGTVEPRKNLAGLLESYASLPDHLRRAHPLVIAGGGGWQMEHLQALITRLGVQTHLRFFGYADDATLAALYRACTALVWPTLYEGFGLPPLEALACGAAVIVSNATSLPEVVGAAGVMLDPHDRAAWTGALERMADDDAWRADFQQRGPGHAAGFTWTRCAAQTLGVYRAALAEE